MSLGLVLLVVEALAVYGLVFAIHAVRDRFTLLPYFALLGVLAAILRWATDAGIAYQFGPLTFILGSVVFLTAILFGVFLLYVFDGVKAAQLGIYTVVTVSILSPALAALFQFQLAELGIEGSQRVTLSNPRIYVASTAAMILDFLFLAITWEVSVRCADRLPLYVRIAGCLLTAFWLDAVLFNVGAFWGEPEFLGILEGNLVSRAVLAVLVSPLVTFYVSWEERRLHHDFTPRSFMAILHRSARREFELFVAQREIEERKRMERELRTSEERLDLALQGGGVGLWDWDIRTDRVVFNERWAEMLGFELRDIKPTSLAWAQLVHADDLPKLRALVRDHLKGGSGSFEYELRMRARDGSWRWILNKGRIVSRTPDGRALRVTGTHLDITRLKETQVALRVSEEMFRLMFEESPLGLILCDLEGRFVQVNPAFCNMLGYSGEEIRARTYFEVTPRDREQEESQLLEGMQRSGRYGPFEIEYLHRDGRRIPTVSNGCLVTGADGMQYIWSIVEDVSPRKMAEEAIVQARNYQREIETRIEETLLRGRPPASLEGVDVAVLNAPSEHMDGDFTDFIPLNPQCFDVLVGDVMGKGVLAALVSAGAKSHFLRAMASQLAAPERPPGAYPRPAALVGEVHRAIARQLIDLDCFLTLCYARFDLAAREMVLVDCGHTKTIRFRAPEHRCTLLEGENVPIGFLEQETYRETRVDLQPGDTFFFYSDGLTESTDEFGSMFGVERLQEAIQLHASLDAAALTREVLATVRDFSSPGANSDDKTCVAVKILAPDATAPPASLRIPAEVNHLATARGFLREYLDRHQDLVGSGEEVNRTVLAYVEALSNVIKHGHAQMAGREIDIECRCSRNRLQIDITHYGRPFRPRSTPLPDPERREECGYGLYIMNRSFDDIAYENGEKGAQRLILVKHYKNMDE